MSLGYGSLQCNAVCCIPSMSAPLRTTCEAFSCALFEMKQGVRAFR